MKSRQAVKVYNVTPVTDTNRPSVNLANPYLRAMVNLITTQFIQLFFKYV